MVAAGKLRMLQRGVKTKDQRLIGREPGDRNQHQVAAAKSSSTFEKSSILVVAVILFFFFWGYCQLAFCNNLTINRVLRYANCCAVQLLMLTGTGIGHEEL